MKKIKILQRKHKINKKSVDFSGKIGLFSTKVDIFSDIILKLC